MKSALDILIEKEENSVRREQALKELAMFRRAVALLSVIQREDALRFSAWGDDGRTLIEHADEVLEDLRVIGE